MIPNEFYKFHKYRLNIIKLNIRNEQRLAGLICSTIANFAPFKKSKKYKIEDFIGKEKKIQTQEEMFNEVKKLNFMFGGEVKIIGNSRIGSSNNSK